MITLREAASDLLETVVAAIECGDWKVDGACDPTVDIIRLKNILAKPEYVTEVVAMHENGTRTVKRTPIQKREWVGLTDEESEDEWRYLEAIYLEEVDPEGYWGRCNFDFAHAIETKLREKNGG